MKKPEFSSAREFIQAIIDRPVTMFFAVEMDVMGEIQENGEYIIKMLKALCFSLAGLLAGLYMAFVHMVTFALYPVTKAVRFYRMRRDVIENKETYIRLVDEQNFRKAKKSG